MVIGVSVGLGVIISLAVLVLVCLKPRRHKRDIPLPEYFVPQEVHGIISPYLKTQLTYEHRRSAVSEVTERCVQHVDVCAKISTDRNIVCIK